MMMQGTLTFQNPILHPLPEPTFAPKNCTPCPLASKPNCISFENHAYKSIPALRACAVQPLITTKSLINNFLNNPSGEKLRIPRDLDCRYLEEKRIERNRGGGGGVGSDDYYAVPEPRFNELVRGDSQYKRILDEEEEAGLDDDDLLNGDSEDGSEGKSSIDDDEDFGLEKKPKPEPSYEDLLPLFMWSHSHPQR